MGARYRPPCLARQPRPRCRNGRVACRRGIDAARADHICTVSNDDVGVLHHFLALEVIVVVQAMLAPTTSRMLTMSASSPYRRRPIVSLVLVLASSCVRGGARALALLTITTVGRKYMRSLSMTVMPAAASLMLATAAYAQPAPGAAPPPLPEYGPSITLEQAMKIGNAALAEAKKKNLLEGIAIVD